jgi:acyl carrier protein
MDEARIRAGVIETLSRIAPELSPAKLEGSRPLRDQIELDSMDWLNVVVALRERFGIEIPEIDYPSLTTLEAIVAYLASKIPSDLPREA